jgi:hypothetical protein
MKKDKPTGMSGWKKYWAPGDRLTAGGVELAVDFHHHCGGCHFLELAIRQGVRDCVDCRPSGLNCNRRIEGARFRRMIFRPAK